MALKIKWTTYALEDINSIAEFIAKDSEYYAIVQVERFFQQVLILETHPNAGRRVPEIDRDDIREIIEGNYRIIYKIYSKSHIDILTVHHSSRLLSNNPFSEEK